jgi:hypothetical protein
VPLTRYHEPEPGGCNPHQLGKRSLTSGGES